MTVIKKYISLRWKAFNMHIDTGISYAQCKFMISLKERSNGI